jgi:acyl-CoA dehydrogenase
MDRNIFEEEHEMFRDAARSFYRNEVKPYSDKWREQGIVDREAFLKAGAQGLLLMWADEKYGGAGVADFRYEQILIEEIAKHGDTGFFMTLHSRLVGPYIGDLGTLPLLSRELEATCQGFGPRRRIWVTTICSMVRRLLYPMASFRISSSLWRGPTVVGMA